MVSERFVSRPHELSYQASRGGETCRVLVRGDWEESVGSVPEREDWEFAKLKRASGGERRFGGKMKKKVG